VARLELHLEPGRHHPNPTRDDHDEGVPMSAPTGPEAGSLLGTFTIQARVRTTTRGIWSQQGTTISLHAEDWRGATAALAARAWPEYTIADTPAYHSWYSFWWEAVLDARRQALTAIVGTEPKSFQRRSRERDVWRPAEPIRFTDRQWNRLLADRVLGVAGVLRPDLLAASDRDWGLAIEYAGARTGPVARSFGDTDHGFVAYRALSLFIRLT
jgi:hypothetical protein